MTRVALVSFIGASIVACTRLEAQDRPAVTLSGMVTIIGCVQRIDESGSLGTTIPERTPTPEQAGVAANRGEPGAGFMLADATSAKNPKPPRGAGTNTAAVRYILLGDESELAKYQGQRVRAQGTLAAAPTKPAETAPVGTSGSAQLQTNTARLRVNSIERVASDCK
jgi:hypothetical protein